jgi:alpha-D-ribose 1-methylphosphonate 5-phosphate C-P lyase
MSSASLLKAMLRFAFPKKDRSLMHPAIPVPAKDGGSLSQLVPTRSSVATRLVPREPQIFTTPKFTNVESDDFAAEPFRLFVTKKKSPSTAALD